MSSVKLWSILLGLIVVGLGLLLVNAHLSSSSWWSPWLGQVATAILISGVMGVIDRQLFFRDSFSKTRELFVVRESILRAGLKTVTPNANEHDYAGMIRESPKLSIVMNDGRTWIGARISDFQQRFAKKLPTEFFFLDPKSPVVPLLAKKTGYTTEAQHEKTQQAIARIKEAFDAAPEGGSLKVYYLPYYPTHTVILGTDDVVVTLYGISSGRRPVPAFAFSRGDDGSVYQHIADDVDRMRNESISVELPATKAKSTSSPASA